MTHTPEQRSTRFLTVAGIVGAMGRARRAEQQRRAAPRRKLVVVDACEVGSATMQAVTPDQMGPAGGVGTVASELGAALGVSLVSAMFSSAGGYASAATFVDGLRPALVAVGVVTAIGVAA